MAFIEEISPANLYAFDELIPKILKLQAQTEGGFHFYGISESGEAAGCVVLVDNAETAEIKFMYIVPYLRGTGVMDRMLMDLFKELYENEYRFVTVNYIPEEFESFVHISKRFGFEERVMDLAYFRFNASDIKKCRAAFYEPRGIVRLKYLPEDKKKKLSRIIEKSITLWDYDIAAMEEILPYSMAYLENEEPKGALIVENPKVTMIPASENMNRFPEPGALDLALFFVGTTTLKAPLYLLSGLCRVIRKELNDNVVMTGYFPEGHVTRLLEGTLGIKGSHEICATLDLSGL